MSQPPTPEPQENQPQPTVETRHNASVGWWNAVLGKIRSLLPQNLSVLSDTALTGIIAAIAVVLVWTTFSLFAGKPTEVAIAPTKEAPPTTITTLPLLEPTPTPILLLTPEQTLISAIEDQVAEISNRIAPGLIQSIQVNFGASSLMIKISDEWYNTQQFQQDKIADQMLQRSQELDFSHLEIIDSQGRLIARNPVVGTEMVIFKRRA